MQAEVRTGSGPLPSGCSPEEVVRFLVSFLDAFTRGDPATLAHFFPEEAVFSDTANPGFQWYSVTDQNGHFVARDPADLPTYFAARRERHEHLHLLRLEVARSWHSGVDIVYDLVRRADDFPERVVGGKGAIDCRKSEIIAWSMGDTPNLVDDESAPTSRPAASSGTMAPSLS